MRILAHARQQPQPPPAADLTALPPAILERLRAEGVRSLSDWRALGRRRHQLFGIVPHIVRQLDDLAREVRP